MKNKKTNNTHVKTDLERALYKSLKKEILKIIYDNSCEIKFKSHYAMDDNDLTIKVEIDCKGADLL